MTLALPRWLADSALPFATATVFLLALVLGGGTQQGFWSDTIIQLASLLLLGLVFLSPNLMQVPREPVFVLCVLVALPLVQVIPLPPTLWTALPGREEIVRGYSAANMSLPWLPISLAPNMTWRSVLSLLPVVAVFLAMLCIPQRSRRNLVVMMLAVVFVSVLLDLLQMMGGGLRFYAITNPDRAVGFFANGNHNAAFLYCAIPFAAAWSIRPRRQPYRAIVVALLLGFIIIGLAITKSRAGLILSVIAGLSCVPLVVGKGRGISRGRLFGAVVGGGVIALLIAFQFGFVGMAQRLQNDDTSLVEDLRWPVASVTLMAAQANLPLGTGFGTFVPVYQTVEPRTLLIERYVNRAHNDWVELGLEGGVLAVVGLLIFFVWFGRSSVQVWRPGQSDADPLDTALARAGSIVVVLLMLHSIVDYPLRTTAMMVVFALACALLIDPKDPITRPTRVSRPTPSDGERNPTRLHAIR
jgi:O-antigen ligase